MTKLFGTWGRCAINNNEKVFNKNAMLEKKMDKEHKIIMEQIKSANPKNNHELWGICRALTIDYRQKKDNIAGIVHEGTIAQDTGVIDLYQMCARKERLTTALCLGLEAAIVEEEIRFHRRTAQLEAAYVVSAGEMIAKMVQMAAMTVVSALTIPEGDKTGDLSKVLCKINKEMGKVMKGENIEDVLRVHIFLIRQQQSFEPRERTILQVVEDNAGGMPNDLRRRFSKAINAAKMGKMLA